MDRSATKNTYKCINCGKEFTTNIIYPHGFLCCDCRKFTKITVKCSMCGKDIQLHWNSYRRNFNGPFRCQDCFNDYQKNNKIEYYKNETEEEKQKRIESHIDGWNNISEELKQSIAKKKSIVMKNKLKDLSHNERYAKISKAIDKVKEKWDNIPRSEHNNYMDHIHNGYDKWRSNLLNNNIAYNEYCNNLSLGQITRYKNPNERLKTSMIMRSIASKITYEEFLNQIYKKVIKWNNDSSKHIHTETDTEEMFKNILDILNIKYTLQYFNTIRNQSFKELFPYNPYYKTEFISPYHRWDFLIHIKPFDIFIDIDGNIHDLNTHHGMVTNKIGNKFNLNDYIQFNDLQRKYQTDNLHGYVIECYNNKLSNDTIVTDIITGKKLPLNQFLNLIAKFKL